MSTLLVALFACNTEPPDITPPAEPVSFPHAEGYGAGVLHGPEALAAGTTCVGCHRDGSTAPTCDSCHDGYPHPEGWLAGAVHGADLGGDDSAAAQAACTACHGTLEALSCTSCHPSYPHPDDWGDAGRHGAWGLSRGSADAVCGSCHRATPSQAPACTSCHADYPHPADFAVPTVHGPADPATCASCHGVDGTGGVAGVACSRCHATYPHPADQKTAHLAVVSQVGEPVCLGCHEAGDGRFPIPTACGAVCHGGPP